MKTLEQVIAEHRLRIDTTGPQPRIACSRSCGWIGPPTGTEVHAHATHVAAAWREERTVRTKAELAALPDDAIVREPSYGNAMQKDSRYSADTWACGDEYWTPDLPVRVLFIPGEEA